MLSIAVTYSPLMDHLDTFPIKVDLGNRGIKIIPYNA